MRWPAVGTATVAVAAGSATEITGAILAAVTPGPPVETETLTSIGSSSRNGSEMPSNSRVSFTASKCTLDQIPANGSATVSFTDTVTDSAGSVASGTVLVTVTNAAINIFGNPYGHSITQGATGTDVFNGDNGNNAVSGSQGAMHLVLRDGNDTVSA